jgi:hypothetical protein
MFANVVAWYAKRIVNVNINIILAGVLALAPVLGVVKLAEHLLASPKFQNGVLRDKLEAHHQLIISAITFLADIIFDVAIYFVLHWLANHTPRKAMNPKVEERMERVADAAAENVPFFKDAAKVQFQRMVMSPLLYFLWLGSQFAFMNAFDWTAVRATVVGFCIAIGTVRTIHTFWMLREERAAKARILAACLTGANARSSPTHPLGLNGTMTQSLSEKGEKSVSRS